MHNCIQCNKGMSSDEVALYKRLIYRGATDNFRCIDCLAKNLCVSVSDLEEKIRHFKEMGCTLFNTN